MPATTNTQQFVAIKEFLEDMVHLKDGSFRGIIEVGSMNFDLKSEEEKIAIILRFQELLNALDFSTQFMVFSRKLDISGYLNELDTLASKADNELIRIQTMEYRKFVASLTQLANIMTKRFFIVVPVYRLILTKGKSQQVSSLSSDEMSKYRTELGQRINLILSELTGLGLTGQILERDELINFFYAFYNPDSKEKIVLSDTIEQAPINTVPR